MALVVEDGTGLSNATSYVSLTTARNYATARGVTLSAVDATLEVSVIKSMDYLESYRDRFKGVKTSETQSLQWPRSGVVIDNYGIDSDELPQILKDCLCQLIIENATNSDLSPTVTDTRITTSEKVDVIEVTYSDSRQSGATGQLVMPKVNNLLNPLLRSGSGLGGIRVERA